MDQSLKQRLVGAIVLVALAVIFLPMLIQGPAPESGAADVSMDVPPAPGGDFETREIPLVLPGGAPAGGALGLDPGTDDGDGALPTVDTATAPDAADLAASEMPDPVDAVEPDAGPANATSASDGMFPPTTAGGDYAVSFGSFSSADAADAVVRQLRSSQLPGFREQAQVDGWAVHRVRIGPDASRADAEAARLRAAHVRDDVDAQVIALNAAVEAPAPRAPAAEPNSAPPP